MVLVQFFITESNNNRWHDLNINGPCSARLVNFIFDHNNALVVQCQSDVFRTPYSASASSAVLKTPTANGPILSNKIFAFDQSHKDFHWNNIVIPGRVYWNVLDTATGTDPSGVWTVVLTFDIEELP